MIWINKFEFLIVILFVCFFSPNNIVHAAGLVHKIIDENGNICYYDVENDVFYKSVEDQWEFQKETTLINGMQVNLAGNFYIYSYDRNANYNGKVEKSPKKHPEGPWDDDWGDEEEDPEGPWEEGSEDEEQEEDSGYIGPSVDAKYAYKTVSFKFEDLTAGKEIYLPQCGESYRYPQNIEVPYYYSTWVVRRNYLIGFIGNMDPNWCKSLQYETHQFRISSVLAETHDYGENWSGYIKMDDSGLTYKEGTVYDNENRGALISLNPWGSVSLKSLRSSMNRIATMPYFYEKPKRPDYHIDKLLMGEVNMELPTVQLAHSQFDVQVGIPVTEKVDMCVNVIPYAISYRLRNIGNSIERRNQISCSYILSLDTQVGYSSWEQSLDIPCIQYLDSLSYSKYNYWKVESVTLKTVRSIIVENPAIETVVFDSGRTPISGSCKGKGDNPLGYLSYETKDVHLELGRVPLSYLLDLQKLSIENRTPLTVWNDKLIINGFELLNGDNIAIEQKEENYNTLAKTQEPKAKIPQSFYQAVFYERKSLEIPKATKNGRYDTKLSVNYEQYNLDESQPTGYWNTTIEPVKSDSISSSQIDYIQVHTPVVCQLTIQDQKELCQLVTPKKSSKQLILGHTYELKFLRTIHSAYYGTDLFNQYTEYREIIFPFDVIIDENRIIQAGEAIIIDGQQTSLCFMIPVWATETTYDISAKTVALNYIAEPDYNSLTQVHSNSEIKNYSASWELPVQLSGQLFDFSIHKISDTNIYGEQEEDRTIMVGLLDKDGNLRNLSERDTLPLMKGSSTHYEQLGVLNTGMTIYYTIDTISSKLTQPEDYIDIKADFYYMNMTGTKGMEVDVYYSETEEDGIVYYHKLEGASPYLDIKLTDSNREYIGISIEYETNEDKKEFIRQAMTKARQRWSGTYHLPKQIFLVPKGMEIGIETEYGLELWGTNDFWLKNGYLVLNFDITTYSEGSGHLSYINRGNESNGYCNMWKKEGFANQKRDAEGTLFQLRDGDIAFYEIDLRSEPWFRVGGTH